MPDRLKELQHQRALVQEQLAWLDREIAAAGVAAEADTAPVSLAIERPLVPQAAIPLPVSSDPVAANIAAEEIMAQYQKDAQSVQDRVKRGCFLYFFLALGLLVLGVFALYLFKTKK